MSFHYAGQRLSFNDALCTVRYHGPLPGQDGEWLGVEWDDPDRGKHAGEYRGRRLFKPLSSAPSCASFIRATRLADQPRSFLQALTFKYAEDGREQTTVEAGGSIEISGKVVEEVGFERIRKQQAALHDLKIVLVDGLRVRGTGAEADITNVQEEVASTCPNITELDLSRNLFEHWRDVAAICAPLTKLRVLKASGLRLMTFDSPVSSAFRHVKELHLNDSLLKPDQTEDSSLDMQFSSLCSLSVAGNNLSTFRLPTGSNRVFANVKILVMDLNAFTSIVPLCVSLIPMFPNLTILSLQRNQISAFNAPGSTSEEPLPVYSSITTLNLSHNAITTPAVISSLPHLFPNLASLRVSSNPFFSSPTGSVQHGNEDAVAFMLTLARLPTLTMLNYSAITDKDRMEGELYYVSVAEREIQTAVQRTGWSPTSNELHTVAQRDWPRYDELCIKYDRENVVEKLASTNNRPAGPTPQSYPPNSLGARLVTITFHLHSRPSSTTTTTKDKETTVLLSLPRTLDVYRVKSLLVRKVGREWGLRPLDFAFFLIRDREEDGGAGVAEEEIPDSTRRIGDWIGGEEVRQCEVEVRPRLGRKEEEVWRMDLSGLVAMMTV